LVRDVRGPMMAIARNNDQLMMIRVGGNAAAKPSQKSRSATPSR
jgi:hypothetical protein